MPNWKKLIVSGSDASLNSLNVTNNVTGNIKITIDGPVGANGLTQQQLTQIFNSEGFKQYVATLGKDTKGSGVTSYQ